MCVGVQASGCVLFSQMAKQFATARHNISTNAKKVSILCLYISFLHSGYMGVLFGVPARPAGPSPWLFIAHGVAGCTCTAVQCTTKLQLGSCPGITGCVWLVAPFCVCMCM